MSFEKKMRAGFVALLVFAMCEPGLAQAQAAKDSYATKPQAVEAQVLERGIRCATPKRVGKCKARRAQVHIEKTFEGKRVALSQVLRNPKGVQRRK